MRNFSPSLAVAALAGLSTLIGSNAKTESTPVCLDPDNNRYKCAEGSFSSGAFRLRACGLETKHWDSIKECAEKATGYDLSKIAELDLRGNALRELTDTDFFTGFTSLRYAWLNRNELMHLSKGVFDPLGETLHTLKLADNRLEEVPDNLFDNLKKIDNIELGSNQLKKLPRGIFDETTTLRRLYLSDNKLAVLNKGVFDNLEKLETLVLSHNRLEELHSKAFDSLKNLDKLELQENELEKLPKKIFDKLTNMVTLELQGNKLGELPDGIFDELNDQNLAILKLSDNHLKMLRPGVFRVLTQVTNLQLQGNKLKKLPTGVFGQLVSLETLRLDDNSLKELESEVFYPLFNQLEYLDLRGNELKCIPLVPWNIKVDVDDGVSTCRE